MNKKVLSAILFSALFAGTGTFTSCIDNDAPEGVEEIRFAKAELIRAKAAVEAAKVAEVNANAAFTNAQAEFQRAQAQAAILRAEYEKALAEAKSAAEIAEIEARVAQLKAETEATIQATENAAKLAQVEFEQALLRLAQAKAALVGEQQAALEGWITIYDGKVAAYNTAYSEYVVAARAYNEALAALEDDSEANIDAKRIAEKNLAGKKHQLEMEQSMLAKLEEELVEAKAATPSDLQAKLAEITEAKDSLVNKLVLLQVEKAEVREANKAEYKKLDELIKAEEKAGEAEVTIPALTVKDWLGKDVKIFAEKSTYTYDNPETYETKKTALENNISSWKGYLLDENDQAWTEAEIITQKAALAAFEKTYNDAKAVWETAVAVYNTTDGTVNMAAFEGYDVVKAAADAFNATLPAYKAAVADQKAKKDALDAASKAYNDAKSAYDKFEEAMEALDKQYAAKEKELEDAIKAVDAGLRAEITELQDAVRQAQIDYQKTYADFLAGLVRESAVARALGDIEEAEEDLQDALEEYEENLDEETEDMIAELNALGEYYKADRMQAELQLQKDLRSLDDNGKDPALLAAINTASENLIAAGKAVTAADKASREAYNALSKAYNEFKKTIPLAPAFLPVADYVEFKDLVVSLTRAQAKTYVETTSVKVWGKLTASNDQDIIQGVDPAYLVSGLTQEDINAILAASGIEEDQYYNWYKSFGAYGTYLNATEQLVKFETALANVDAVKASIASLETALADLKAGFEAAEAAVTAAADAVTAQYEVIDEFEKVVTDKIEATQFEYDYTAELWMAYSSATGLLGDNTSAAALEQVVKDLESDIRDQQQTIYDMETSVMKAEKALEDWNSTEAGAVEIKKAELEDAEYALNAAKTAVDEAKAYLDAALKALEAVTE